MSDLSSNLYLSRLLDFYGKLLNERQEDICRLYYNDDLSLSEISEQIGITRQGVRDALKKSEHLLTDYESRLGLLSKFDAMQTDVQKILSIVEKSDKLDKSEFDEISILAQKILT